MQLGLDMGLFTVRQYCSTSSNFIFTFEVTKQRKQSPNVVTCSPYMVLFKSSLNTLSILRKLFKTIIKLSIRIQVHAVQDVNSSSTPIDIE